MAIISDLAALAGEVFMPPICLHCASRPAGEPTGLPGEEGSNRVKSATAGSPRRWKAMPLCRPCLRRLGRIKGPVCPRCGQNGCVESHADWDFPFGNARFLFTMGPELSSLVHGFKYRHLRRHIPFLCAFARYRPDLREFLRARHAIAPVPLHAARRRERGYNQAEAIADELGRWAGLPVFPRALKRTRSTGTQTKLGRGQRQGNLKGAFACPRGDALRGLKVVLVDDVFTTGATVSECARLLLKAGCASVDVVALARVDANPVHDDFAREMELAAGYCL